MVGKSSGDTFSPDFSAFVFKIQANMNKAHRDRLAFMRICSGQFQRDAEYYHVQSGKKMRLSQPQQLMASEREIVDEAYAGDIIGVFDPGIFSIGDTITVPGKKFKFGGIPTFAPEHFARVSAKDSMKRKQFLKGTEQIAQEGAIQIFKVPNSGMEEVIVGVVGTLTTDDGDRCCCFSVESHQDCQEVSCIDTKLCCCTKQETDRICNQRTKVRHRTDTHKDQGRQNTPLIKAAVCRSKTRSKP